jgi:hypothetical protein
MQNPPVAGSAGREFEERVLALVLRLARVADSAGRDDVVARLDAVRRQLSDGQFTVVVLGAFSSGKSSLLNALLEQPGGLFPVDSFVSTRVVTTAQWGVPEAIALTLDGAEGGQPETRAVGRDELRGYVSEAEVRGGTAAADARRVRSVSIELPSEKLRDGLVLIDTPGIGSGTRSHFEAALGTLSPTDADGPGLVLYVLDARQLPRASDLAFIERVAQAVNVAEFPERLLFVVTKADLEFDWEELADDAGRRLAPVPGIGARPVILPVSSQARLSQLAGKLPLDDSATGFGPFEALLHTSAARTRLRLRAGSALGVLDLAVQGLLDPARTAREVLEAKSAGTKASLQAQADEQEAEARRLTEGEADWPAGLSAAFGEITRSLQTSAAADLAAIWGSMRAGYRSPGSPWLDDPQLIIDELAARLGVLVAKLGDDAAARTAQACATAAGRSGIQLHGPVLAGISLPAMPVPAPGGRVRLADNLALAFEAAGRAAEVGAAAGAPVGQLLVDKILPALTAASGAGVGSAVATGAAKAVAGNVAKTVADNAAEGSRAGTAANALAVYLGSSQSPGAIIGTAGGAVVGAAVGFFGAVRELGRMDRAERLGALDDFFAEHEAVQRDLLLASVRDIVGAAAALAEADLRARIAQRQADCAATKNAVDSAMEASAADSAAMEQQLSTRIAELEGIQHELSELAGDLRARLGERAAEG